jgi:hypothetical protein
LTLAICQAVKAVKKKSETGEKTMKKAILLTSILFAVLFSASQNSFAQQGPCLLGVGNCTQTNTNTNVDPGKRRVHITDHRAGEIYRAKQNNQRYLLTLQTYQENGFICEERAWVGGDTFAGDSTQVIVSVGPTKKVCYDPAKPIWTAQQVNTVEQYIDTWSSSIYQWEKYAENCVNYINQYRTNPPAVNYGQTELAKARAWVTYYQNAITSYRNAVNQVAP